MSKDHPLLIREQVIKAIRLFFQQRKFHEIVIPILNQALPLEPNIYAFRADWHESQRTHFRYLPTSPEATLKKALAQELEKVFAISPTFRDTDPSDSDHHPEFLMLEWYRADADYLHIMAEFEELIYFVHQQLAEYLGQDLVRHFPLSSPWQRFTVEQLFTQVIGEPLAEYLPLDQMRQLAVKFGYDCANATWEQLFNQLFIEQIEPILGEQPTLVIDYPVQLSSLCKPHLDRPAFAQRFEAYINGFELANGNTEETDTKKITRQFDTEKLYRQKNQLVAPPIDQEFLSALATLNKTGREYAGIGVGVDRLAMVLGGVKAINEFDLKLI